MSREERIKVLEIMLRIRKEQKDIVECAGGFCKNCNEDIQALQETIQDLKKLDEEEQKILYDLVGETKDEIPADAYFTINKILDYLNENYTVTIGNITIINKGIVEDTQGKREMYTIARKKVEE